MADGNNNNNAGNADALNEGTEAAIKHAKAVKEVTDKYGDYEKQLEAIKEKEKQLADLEGQTSRSAKKKRRRLKADIEQIKQITGATEDLAAANKELTDTFIDQSAAVDTLASSLGPLGSVAVSIYGEFEKFKKQQEKIAELAERGLDTTGMEEYGRSLRNVSIASKAIAPIAGQFDKILAKTIELATAQIDAENNLKNLYNGVSGADDTTKSFVTTITELENVTTEAGFATKELGIETGKLYTTFEALSKQYTLLRGQTKEYQQELIAGAAILERTGVAIEDVGAAANTLNRIFPEYSNHVATTNSQLVDHMQLSGDNAKKTIKFAQALNSIGVEAGRGPGELVGIFNQLSPQLMKIGKTSDDLVDTMSDLAYASRQSGIEIGRIVDFTSQFDTFEGAADRVGKLNAILGGDFLNVMDLMAAENPAERMQMVTAAINEQGKSFQDLTYYERLALAEAGGFKDVGELALAMSGNFDIANNSLHKTTEEYAAAALRAKEYQTFQQQIEATMVALAKQEGFSAAVTTGINAFLKFMTFMADNGTFVVSVLVALKGAQLGLAAAQLALALSAKAASKEMGGGKGGLSPGLKALGGGLVGAVLALGFVMFMMSFASNLLDGIGKFSMAILAMGVAARIGGKHINKNLVLAMLALGAALAMALYGIGAAAEGIGSMADSISKLNAEQVGAFNNALIGLVGTLALFTTGIVLLGIFATGPQMLGILGVAAAFFLIGTAIGIAAAGMGLFATGVAAMVDSVANGIATVVDSIVTMSDSLAAGPGGGAMLGMAAGLYAMAGSLVVFAAAAVILTPAIMYLQGAMAIGKLLGVAPEQGDIKAFSAMVQGLSTISPDNLTKTVEQVSRLRNEMSQMMDSPDMVKDFTDMLEVFERDMKIAYNIENKRKADQKAELTITSPITIKVSDDVTLIGKIDERVLAKMNFTR